MHIQRNRNMGDRRTNGLHTNVKDSFLQKSQQEGAKEIWENHW